jgi:hypothetical protein
LRIECGDREKEVLKQLKKIKQ